MPELRRIETVWGELSFEPVGPAAGDAGRDAPALADDPTAPGGAPTRCANGARRADRAVQFMPFAALQGYYDLVRETEQTVEERHELTEDEACTLSRTVAELQAGDMVRVTFYDKIGYRTRVGCVARVDADRRQLQLVKTVIDLDDVRAIARTSTSGKETGAAVADA